MADIQTLLSICDRVHIVLTRKDTMGEVHLVSSHFLEWRQVLCAPASKTNRILELNGIGEHLRERAALPDEDAAFIEVRKTNYPLA